MVRQLRQLGHVVSIEYVRTLMFCGLAPLQREGRLLLLHGGGDRGGVADAEGADAAGQRLLAIVGVVRWRRRLQLRWLLQRLQEVVRPEEETCTSQYIVFCFIQSWEYRTRQRWVMPRTI